MAVYSWLETGAWPEAGSWPESVVLKRELCTKAKLSIFRSVYVSILTCGRDRWIMNEKVKSRVQAADMGCLRRSSGLT